MKVNMVPTSNFHPPPSTPRKKCHHCPSIYVLSIFFWKNQNLILCSFCRSDILNWDAKPLNAIYMILIVFFLFLTDSS